MHAPGLIPLLVIVVLGLLLFARAGGPEPGGDQPAGSRPPMSRTQRMIRIGIGAVLIVALVVWAYMNGQLGSFRLW